MIDTACWRGLCVSMAQRKNMRAETRRMSLGARGDPEFGSWFACTSISVIDDDGTSSSTRARHQADPCAGRDGCEHRALCRLMPHLAHGFAHWCTPIAVHRIAAFRDSVRDSVGGFRRRATAVVRALGNAANGNWEFGPGYFSKTAHASLRGAG